MEWLLSTVTRAHPKESGIVHITSQMGERLFAQQVNETNPKLR